jgi:4-phospho-D-threonate 3-dehydrogenase / 4-phospho-D-erythronate 3-dehydrogenase
MKSRIAITLGDPAGVGPEIVLRAALSPRFRRSDNVVVADHAYLRVVAARLHRRGFCVPPLVRIPYREWTSAETASLRGLVVVDLDNVRRSPSFGKPTAWGGKASGDYIRAGVEAVTHCLADALVTLPINKQSFRLGGWGKESIGHTEFLASLTGTPRVALMLSLGKFRAVHVTQHIALNRVAASITRKRIEETIRLTHEGLTQMGIRKPRIGVCGLNPHAGDGGLMGNEEQRLITPAIRSCKADGIRVSGPMPADSLWPHVRDGRFDAGVAMYHDQGQVAVKLLGFQSRGRHVLVRGVNTTLGLPIIRTSVAHGTAFDIAGRGIASAESLLDAIELASTMAKGKTWN